MPFDGEMNWGDELHNADSGFFSHTGGGPGGSVTFNYRLAGGFCVQHTWPFSAPQEEGPLVTCAQNDEANVACFFSFLPFGVLVWAAKQIQQLGEFKIAQKTFSNSSVQKNQTEANKSSDKSAE